MKLTELLDRDLVNRTTVPVLIDPAHAQRIVDAERELGRATRRLARQTGDDTAVTEAQQELDAALEAAEPHLVDFEFQSIGSSAWQELLLEHRPTPEQKANGLDYNPDTFVPAVMQQCMADPAAGSTLEVRKLEAKLPRAVWGQLWAACLQVNLQTVQIPAALTARRPR